MTTDEIAALEKLALLLENDIDALGWDQDAQAYALRGPLSDPHADLLAKLGGAHPVDALTFVYLSGGRLPVDAIGIGLCTENWQAKTVEQIGFENIEALVPPIAQVVDVMRAMGAPEEEIRRIVTSSWNKVIASVSPSDLPNELRLELRQVMVMTAENQLVTVRRDRGAQPQVVRETPGGIIQLGRLPQALLNMARGAFPEQTNERSVPDLDQPDEASDAPSAPPQLWMCQVCGRVLDGHADEEGSSLQHTQFDAATADHEPVPVLATDEVKGRCDFCHADGPRWRIPANDFVVIPGHEYIGDWAACDECVALVKADNWTLVVERAAEAMSAVNGRKHSAQELLPLVAMLYSQLRQNITGPPHLINGGP